MATRILIVEDEILIAQDLEATLTDLGFDVVSVATTGEESVTAAESTRPDVVLMDVHLAGKMEGIGAAYLIHERSRIPIIFVTASACVETRERARAAEPIACLRKNCSAEEQDKTIQEAVKRSFRDNRNP